MAMYEKFSISSENGNVSVLFDSEFYLILPLASKNFFVFYSKNKRPLSNDNIEHAIALVVDYNKHDEIGYKGKTRRIESITIQKTKDNCYLKMQPLFVQANELTKGELHYCSECSNAVRISHTDILKKGMNYVIKCPQCGSTMIVDPKRIGLLTKLKFKFKLK